MCNVFTGTIRICIKALCMCYMQLQLPAKIKKSTKAGLKEAGCKGTNASTDATSNVGSNLPSIVVHQN